MIRTLPCSIFLMGLCASASAAEPAFRYSKPLELPELSQEELLAAAFDSDVYAATRDGFPDVRVRVGTNDDGNRNEANVSFVIRKTTTTKSETTRNYWRAAAPSIKPLEDDGLEIVIRLDKNDPQPQGLRLVTPLANFEQRVRIFGSADGTNWKPLGEETAIFDYAQFMDVRSDAISFPESTDRYFRIVIDNVTQELESQLLDLTRRLRGGEETQRDERIVIQRRPFRIDRIDFWREVEQAHHLGDRKVAYPVNDFRTENDADAQQSIIYLESRREPLTSFQLITASHNFSRRARVEIQQKHGSRQEWRPIGKANLSQLDFHDLKRENLKIEFPESRQTAYRIVIDNRGSPPLTMTGVTAEGNEYRAVFLSGVPQQSYELAYGSGTAEAPDFDVAAIDASLAAGYAPNTVALGKQTASPDVGQPVAFSFKQFVNDPWLLGGIAFVLIAALAWGLFLASRRLDGLPQDGD